MAVVEAGLVAIGTLVRRASGYFVAVLLLLNHGGGGFIGWLFFSWDVEPVSWGATVSDMLSAVANVHMESAGIVIEITNYDLRVGLVLAFDVIDVKFALQRCGNIDGDDRFCKL